MILLLAYVLASAAPAAQPYVSQDSTAAVIVRLRHNAAPVAGAVVRAESRTALSDVRGDARLRLPVGPRSLEVVRLGFADTTVVVPVHAGMGNSVTIELREVALETEAVVATATRSGAVISEQPIRVEAVPTEEIEENQSVAPGNLRTLLEELPGVRVAPAAPGLGGAGLQLRGLPARMTQVLIDGLPLLGTEADAFSMLQTPPLDLARVEVVKGVASALYGGAATAGVLNLVSKTPLSDSQLLLNRSSRAESDVVGFFAHGFSPHWGGTLTASANDQQRRDLDRDGWSEIAGYRRVVVRPRLFWNAGPTETVLATVGITSESRHGGATFHPADLTTTRFDGGATGHVLLPADVLLGARIAATQQKHERTAGATVGSDRLNTFLGELTVRGSNGGQVWLLGAAFDYDALSVPANSGVDYRYRTPALFAQDEFSLASWVSASLSARADFNNQYGTFFSPRGALLLRATPRLSIRVSAGTGWAPPRPVTDEIESVGFARVLPLVNLVPERVRNASVDADWRVSHLELSLGAFAATIRHGLSERTVATVAPPRLELYNLNGARMTRGAEALLHFTQGELQLLGSYTYLWAAEDSAGGRRWQAGLPRHAGEVGAIMEREGRGRVGVEVGYTGSMHLEDDPYRTSSRPYWEVNVLAARYFHESALFVNAINLFNVRQSDSEPLLRPAPSRLGEVATPVWGSLEGRVINLGVRIEL